MTPTDLITLTLRVCRVLGQGQTAPQQQLTDALSLLNMMMGQWARKRWMVYHLLELKATGYGGGTFNLGPGGDFSVVNNTNALSTTNYRVSRIESAFVRMNAGTPGQADRNIAVLRAYEDWASIPAKNVQAGYPQAVFLDTGYPIATVYVWPAMTNLYELHLLVLMPLPRFSALNTDINMPDEYQEALVYNLAKRLMSLYGKAPDGEINARAMASLQTVKAANLQIPLLQLPRAVLPTGGRTYNIYTDT